MARHCRPRCGKNIHALNLFKMKTHLVVISGLAGFADQLGISVPTVRFHLQHIYEKLHVHSRTSSVLKFQAERKAPGSLT